MIIQFEKSYPTGFLEICKFNKPYPIISHLYYIYTHQKNDEDTNRTYKRYMSGILRMPTVAQKKVGVVCKTQYPAHIKKIITEKTCFWS
jgi:hypothetical protein